MTLPSTPQGVEVGNDGRALISLLGTGVVAGVPQGTLLVFDRTQTASHQLLNVVVPALPTTPVPIPVPTLPRPVTTFSGKLLRTPNGQFIVGVLTPTVATTYVFVYEVASGVVLRNRTISGASSVLSMAPDGSRFMAGFSLFDTATLACDGATEQRQRAVHFRGRFQHRAEHRRQHVLAGRHHHLQRLQHRGHGHAASTLAFIHAAGERFQR